MAAHPQLQWQELQWQAQKERSEQKENPGRPKAHGSLGAAFSALCQG